MSLVVREMALDEVGLIIDYFHGSTPEYLEMMGVDPTRLPNRRDWQARYVAEYAKPLEQRSTLLVMWELDGVGVGFSSSDKIVYGEQAHMLCMSSIRSVAVLASGLSACARRSTSISRRWP